MLYTIYTSDEAGNIVERVSLDCVSDFTENYKLSIANNTVENGTSIADNTTFSNDEFNISGIVSDYSFRRKDKLIVFQDGEFVVAEADDQFVDTSIVDSPSIEIKRKLKEFHKNSEILGILVSNREYNGNIDNEIERLYPVIMTSLSFKETTNSLDAIFPSMNFEQVRFSSTLYSKEQNVPAELNPLTKAATNTGTTTKGVETSVSGAAAVGYDQNEVNKTVSAVTPNNKPSPLVQRHNKNLNAATQENIDEVVEIERKIAALNSSGGKGK